MANLKIEIPNRSNNYMLPLDSPKSPRPNSTVDAVAMIVERIIASNEKFLLSLQGKAPKYKFPRLIQAFDYSDGSLLSFEKLRKLIYNFSYRTRLRNETLVGVILYLDRLVQRSGIVIAKHNYLLVLAISLVASQKLYDDFHYSLKDYGVVVGIPLPNLLRAEHAFLKLIRYDLVVNPDEYNQYRSYIVQKFDATLREAMPFSPSQTIEQGFQLRDGIASVKDIGDYLLHSLHQMGKMQRPADDGPAAYEAPICQEEIDDGHGIAGGMATQLAFDKDETRETTAVEAIKLPGGKF